MLSTQVHTDIPFLFHIFGVSSFAIGRTKSVEWRKEQLKAVDRFEAD